MDGTNARRVALIGGIQSLVSATEGLEMLRRFPLEAPAPEIAVNAAGSLGPGTVKPNQLPIIPRCAACSKPISANKFWCLAHRNEAIERIMAGSGTQQDIQRVMAQSTAAERIVFVDRLRLSLAARVATVEAEQPSEAAEPAGPEAAR